MVYERCSACVLQLGALALVMGNASLVYMSDAAFVHRSSATCSLLASFFLGGLLGHLLGHFVRRLHLLAALKARATVAGANS